MKKGGWSGALLAAALFLCPDASAQTVGTIQMQDALTATGEMKHAIQDIARQFQPRRTQLRRQQAEWDAKPDGPSLSFCGTGLKPGDIPRRVNRQLLLLQEDLERDEAASHRTRREAIRGKMLQIVRTIAEAKGIDVVLDAKAIYAGTNLDLTAEAIAAYNKLHPVH